MRYRLNISKTNRLHLQANFDKYKMLTCTTYRVFFYLPCVIDWGQGGLLSHGRSALFGGNSDPGLKLVSVLLCHSSVRFHAYSQRPTAVTLSSYFILKSQRKSLTLRGLGVGITCRKKFILVPFYSQSYIRMAIQQYFPAPCWMLISAQWAEISIQQGCGSVL